MEDSTIEKGKKRKKELRYFECSGCHTMITCEGEPSQKIKFECPNCRKKSIIDFNLGKHGKILPLTKNKSKDENLSSEKTPMSDYKILTEKTRLQFSEKISLNTIIWIIFSFIIIVTILSLLFIAATGKIYIDTLYVSIFIGVMIIREAIDEFIPNHLKKKMNFITGGLAIAFLGILINDIISLISK